MISILELLHWPQWISLGLAVFSAGLWVWSAKVPLNLEYSPNWTQLKRIVETEGFPPGIMLAPNTRAWVITEVIAWLATRPVAGAVKKLESA